MGGMEEIPIFYTHTPTHSPTGFYTIILLYDTSLMLPTYQ
jgi:hypothetical protein